MTTLPTETVLSLEQAADCLNVSLAYLMELLDSSVIPHHQAGGQQRILLHDLLRYKEDSKAKRREALAELVAQAQALDMGYGKPN